MFFLVSFFSFSLPPSVSRVIIIIIIAVQPFHRYGCISFFMFCFQLHILWAWLSVACNYVYIFRLSMSNVAVWHLLYQPHSYLFHFCRIKFWRLFFVLLKIHTYPTTSYNHTWYIRVYAICPYFRFRHNKIISNSTLWVIQFVRSIAYALCPSQFHWNLKSQRRHHGNVFCFPWRARLCLFWCRLWPD